MRLLTGLLVVNAVALAAMLVVDLLEWSLMQRILAGEADVLSEALASDDRQLLARTLLLASYATTVVVFCTWLFEAGRNLRALGVGDLRWTEEARVLWFFVPVAAFVVPLFGMRELWRASANPTRGVGWRSEKVPLFVTAWWLIWALSGVLAWWSLGMRWRAELAEEVAAANELGIAYSATRLLAIPLLLAVVLGVHRHQMRAAATE